MYLDFIFVRFIAKKVCTTCSRANNKIVLLTNLRKCLYSGKRETKVTRNNSSGVQFDVLVSYIWKNMEFLLRRSCGMDNSNMAAIRKFSLHAVFFFGARFLSCASYNSLDIIHETCYFFFIIYIYGNDAGI